MALGESKKWEKIFDTLIDPGTEQQLDIFEEPQLVLTSHGIERRPVVASMEGEEQE